MSVTADLNFDLFVPQEKFVVQTMAETTAAIATHNFQWRYITLLLFNSTLLIEVNQFLKLYDKTVITSRGMTEPRNSEETRQFVIFGENIQQITHMLDWMIGYNFDNTGRFIVICESKDCDETEAVATFWYHKITNVIFLKYSGDTVHGFTYFYSEKNCAMSDPVRIYMDCCIKNISSCNMYPEKFANLHKCPLIASTFQQPPYMMNVGTDKPIRGADGSLLRILAKTLNATLKIMTPYRGDGWGSLDSNGSWLGSLGDVYYDLANISMTSAALTLNRFSHFQLSYNYNFVVIGWITSPTKLASSSLKLLHPFKVTTHIAVVITFILVIVCSILLSSKLWRQFKRRLGFSSRKKNNVVFYSWMICMGLPTAKLPRKPVLLYLAFLWIWYTFLIRTMYQASLINSLKTNVYAANIDTIEAAIKEEYKFGGGFALRDYFINYPEVYDNYIGMNFSELHKLVYKVSEGEKFALSINLEAVTSLYLTRNEPIHFMHQKIVVSPTAIFFKKFSPLARSLNKKLLRLIEAGISDKLYRIYVTKAQKRRKRSTNKGPMTIEHFTGCYAILFAGWSVSVLFFFFELCCGFKNISAVVKIDQ